MKKSFLIVVLGCLVNGINSGCIEEFQRQQEERQEQSSNSTQELPPYSNNYAGPRILGYPEGAVVTEESMKQEKQLMQVNVNGSCNCVCVCSGAKQMCSDPGNDICLCPVNVKIKPIVSAALNLCTCGKTRADEEGDLKSTPPKKSERLDYQLPLAETSTGLITRLVKKLTCFSTQTRDITLDPKVLGNEEADTAIKQYLALQRQLLEKKKSQ